MKLLIYVRVLTFLVNEAVQTPLTLVHSPAEKHKRLSEDRRQE